MSRINRYKSLPRVALETEEHHVDLNSIVVEGWDEVDLDLVEMYFDNRRRSSGGSVIKIEQIPGTSRVLVTFKDPKVAEEVLKRTHELTGISLSVARPPHITSLLYEGSQVLDTADSSISRSTSIRVSGVRDGLGEDFVKMFFENKRRSGGGAVANCQASGDGYVVTFENCDVVDSVMARHTEKPLELSNSILQISIIPPVASLPGMAASWLIDDAATSCTIKVSGLPVSEAINLELLKMFFENRKRSGGGGKVEVVPMEDENFAVVVFESTENVGRVFQQYGANPFTVNHSRLTLEILRPLPVPALPPGDLCPRSLLCRGIYGGTTSVEIKKFFAERLNYKVNRLTFCLKPGIVLIQFVIDVDYCNVIKAARSFPVGPVMVCLERVPVSNSVQVYNYGNLTEQSLVLCLEDHRGVAAEVSQVEERTEEGCMIVHLEDGSVIPQLLENPPTIEGHRLQFNIYHECLGLIPPEVNSSEPICLLPSDVSLKFDPDVLEYISCNKEELDQLQKDLSVEHGALEFPQQKGDGKVTLVCQLKKNSPDLNKLSKNWAERCTEKAKSFVSLFSSRETGVLQDFWEMLKEKLSEEMKSGRKVLLRITINDASHSVSYVGRKIACDDLHHKIERFIAEIEDHMDMQKGTVTEKIDCLNIHQLHLLKSIKFFDEDAGGLTITFDGLYPVLTGQSSEAMAINIKMFEILNRIVSESYQPPQHTIRMLNEENFVKYLQESLQKQSIKVVWEMGSNGITVYGLTQAEVDNGVKIMKDEFIYREIPLNEQSKLALTHPAWGERKVEFKNHATLIIEEDEEALKVFATSNIVEAVIERINGFIKEFTIHRKVISFKRGICKILSIYKPGEIDAICKSFANSFVKILPKEKGFEIHGTQFGLPPAEKKLRELANGVIIQEEEIDRPGMANYFLSERGKDHVETVQGKHRVYIENSADTSGNSDDESVNQVLEVSSGNSRSVEGNLVVAQAVLDRGITVSIIAGDITTCRVDAIVNSANVGLKHIGGIAKSIADAGGDVIQRECDDFVRKSGRVFPGSLYVSQPGLLPCKAVFHVVGPIWQGGWSNEENILFQAVTSVLEEMVKQGYSSVALPAISTGIYGFPLNKACKIILEAIRDFVNKIVSHSLISEICIIDNSGAANDMFSRELRRLFSDKVVQPGEFRVAEGGSSRAGNGGEGRGWEVVDEECGFRKMSRSKSDLGGATYGRGVREKQSFERKSDQAADERRGAAGGVPSGRVQKLPMGWTIKLGNLTVEVSQGDITREKSDAIVNSSNENLDLSLGKVSNSILKKGGYDIQNECSKIVANGEIHDGLAVSLAGNLDCNYIFHLISKHGDRDWKSRVERCLQRAATMKLSSISFPLLGTGNMGKSASAMAGIMLDAISKFSRSPGSLRLVRITIYEEDMVKKFADGLHNKMEGASGFLGKAREMYSTIKSYMGGIVDPSMEIHDLPTSRHCSFETKVCFRFFALRREDIDSAVKDLEKHCYVTVTDKVIEGDYSDVIKKLSSEQIAVILNMENIYPVSIKVEQGRLNRIRIRGEAKFLLIIQENLFKIFREAEKSERDDQEKKFAEMVAKQAQWMYEDGTTFTEYPQEINILIEKAYYKKDKCVEWQENDGNYRLDFEKEREFTVGVAGGGIKVKRVSSGDATLPNSWDAMKSGEKTKRVKLTTSSQEWKDVEQFARTTSGTSINNIFSIERIQNPSLYMQYMMRKKQMEKIATPAFPSERKLWHGTAMDTLESIERGGFNRSYCGINAVAYGRGVYFASQFSYSASNSYSIPDPNTGYQYVYQTLVLTGEYVQGDQKFIVPPSTTGAFSAADCYDSVVDNVSSPTIFVIFNDVQAYPEYLITFN